MMIKRKSGNTMPLAVALTLALLLIVFCVFEYMKMMIITTGVRDAVQSAVISVAVENYDEVYSGLREGYSGGYNLTASGWEQIIDCKDIYAELDKILGLTNQDDQHIKYTNEKVEFKVYDFDMTIINAPFAPNAVSSNFIADSTIKVEVPVSFLDKELLPLIINLKIKSTYLPKF